LLFILLTLLNAGAYLYFRDRIHDKSPPPEKLIIGVKG
jgi:hypothetical protein